MSEEEDLLKSIEPSWKNIPAPPARLPVEGGGNIERAAIPDTSVIHEIETSDLPEIDTEEDPDNKADEPVVLDYFISYANDTEAILIQADIYEDYDSELNNNWSANFEVVSGSMTGGVTYSDDVDRFPDDGGDPATQTFYRLPLIRGGEQASTGGFYQEDTLCLNGTGRQQLLKMG